MTNTHTYKGQKVCEGDGHYVKCKPKREKNKEILLECGEGTGNRTFTSSDDAAFQLAHVTVDTTCLCKSEVLIKFSSLVRVERFGSDENVRLQYELLRACGDEDPITLGTWIFEKIDISTSDFLEAAQESFNFIFCDCSICTECCDYFVVVKPIEINNTIVTVSNGRMAAVVQSVKKSLKDEYKIEKTKNDYTKSKPRRLESKEAILACGRGNGSVIFKTEDEQPIRIASVEIDTSCLCKPKVLIEFSSIISYIEEEAPDESIIFNFELFRRCNNREATPLGVWTYEIGDIEGEIQAAQGFGFTYCECVNFSGCCEYFVILTPIEVPTEEQEFAMISNSRMTALAQSSKSYVMDYESNCPKPKEVSLICGSGTGRRIFNSSDEPAFQLAEVSVDTKGLCKPTVNIEFSSIVSFVNGGGELNALLRYELIRVCEDGIEESRGVWVLERIDLDTDQLTESFDFTFCEQTICDRGCCTYFVRVTPIEIEGGQIVIDNGRIAALVQER